MDQSGSEWVRVDQSGSEWVRARFSTARFDKVYVIRLILRDKVKPLAVTTLSHFWKKIFVKKSTVK